LITVGAFFTDEKKYCSNHFQDAFEIVSLTGTIGVPVCGTISEPMFCEEMMGFCHAGAVIRRCAN
jgi:hypothetical protein